MASEKARTSGLGQGEADGKLRFSPSFNRPITSGKAGVDTRERQAARILLIRSRRSRSITNGLPMKLAVRHRKHGWITLWILAPLLAALAPSNSYALDPAKSLFQYNCQTWRRLSGLPANGVNAIVQTQDGYLWLGTANGLVRFDGSDFKLLDLGRPSSIRSSVIKGLSNSRRGGFWFGLEQGAFGYSDGTGVSLLGKEPWGGGNLNVHAVLETREGDLWIAAETLAARVSKNQKFEVIMNTLDDKSPLRFDVTAMTQDAQGRVWLGTARRGLYYWLNGTLTRFPDPAMDELTIRSLVEDRQGRLWVGTDFGLLCFDAAFRRQPLPFPWYPTYAVLEDRQGAVWAGTSGGVMRFLKGAPTALRRVDGLADDFVTALAEDKEGSVWVGTRDGLSQLSDVKFPTFGKNEGLSADVLVAVCASRQGGLWVATSQGFTYFNRTADHYSSAIGLHHDYINGIFEAKNNDVYLINGAMDIEVFSGGKIVARYPNRTWPLTMTEDDKSVVAAVAGDLFRVNTNSFVPYHFTGNRKPPLNWIWSLATARDAAIWVGSDQGICRVKDGSFTLWNKQQGLSDDRTTWVCEDSEGVIWAGLSTGMARIKAGQIRNLRQEDGLFDNLICAIVPDDYGNFWVDSGRGVFRVSRQLLNDFADGKTNRIACASFNGLDAVKSAEKNQQRPSGCKTLDGNIWFPTAQGIVMINPTNIPANPVPPQVHIHSVRANGQELADLQDAVVRPGKGELDFHYVGVSYIAPLKIQYRHKLDGFDKNWVMAGTRRSAFYTNLKPGKYRFEVQACNEDAVWNSIPETRTVVLPPHYYQTVWFRMLETMTILAGLAGIFNWQVSRWKRRQKRLQEAHDLLERRVRERTNELAASNTSLKNEIAERQRMELEIERVHQELLLASRQAGQAEVASSVLHNVGNALNSVNISATVIADRLAGIQIANLEKVADLLQGQGADLARFLTGDEKGRHVIAYLRGLTRHLTDEQRSLLREIGDLTHNIDHIKKIVSMQQAYAQVAGITERVAASELVETALKIQSGAFARQGIDLARAYDPVPLVTVDKHKVAQVLVNLLQNARQACAEGGRPDPRVVVRIQLLGGAQLRIAVTDNGVGIAPENLTRIFSHGFTTRKDGHGFGLHGGALAARELGGRLSVLSEGIGQGATFLLDLPLEPAAAGDAPAPRSPSVPTGGT